MAALAAVLIAVYFALQPTQPPSPQPTTTQPPPTTTPPRIPQTSTTPATATTSTNTPQTTTTQTYTTTARAPIYLPKIEVQIVAPKVVNTTKLPFQINYTIVIRNVGNGTGSVDVAGSIRRLAPGEEAKIDAHMTARRAGLHTVEVDVNGTRYTGVVAVYYYAPMLVAEPLAVNVTSLPTNVTLSARIRNVGNYTARVAGVEIRPGEEKTVNITVAIEVAGSTMVEVEGVKIPLSVYYLVPKLEWRIGGPPEVEAVPGETYPVWLWVKNTGNATAELSIDGKNYSLAPGKGLNTTKIVTVDRAGVYDVGFQLKGAVNATVKHTLVAKIVAPKVELVIWSPELKRSWPLPNTTDETTLSVVEKTATLKWGYIISTNATRRIVTLIVEHPDGVDKIRLAPGETASKNFTTTSQAPGSAEAWVKINSTLYKLKTSLQLTPLKITISDVSKIEFSDNRQIEVKITCQTQEGPRGPNIKILSVSGTLTYTSGGRQISGTLKAYWGSEYSGDYRGEIKDKSGWLLANIFGYSIYIEFTTSPLAVTKILINGEPRNCEVPTSLAPSIFYAEKPTATEVSATEYAVRLVSAFARTDSEKPQSATWNGEYVEVQTRDGTTLKVYFESGKVRIEGPLTASLVIS
ncbi:hypothetical protein P186_2304 [Pyrobaculum ferrireducens]|uniref:Uncharacterized protein n=2 Tax=Pyrobaculum ferrireducens TaxID=1104324 RepID=G7VBS7_9CREN|nr:hypothetical protein P186_2304 [Pyrobaculum ferrireducens]